MKLIDLHQDVLFHQRGGGGVEPDSQTSFETLGNDGAKIVWASVFIPPEGMTGKEFSNTVTRELSKYLESAYVRWNRIHVVRSSDSAVRTLENRRCGLLLHLEGLYGWPEDGFRTLESWYGAGLRSLGIVWNTSNYLGGGCCEPYYSLTKRGEEVLEWCEDRGVVVDLAHTNKRTFYGAIDATKGPVIVSHANAFELCHHPRNLTDNQIKAIASREGVIGISFVGGFLVNGRREPGVHDVVDHIEYVRDLVGPDYVAIGSDFGGMTGRRISGLSSFKDLPFNLCSVLERRGWNLADIEKVMWKNAFRVIRQVLH